MKVNGEAIYGTHPIRPYAADNICLTQSKDSLSTFAFYLGETVPAEVSIDHFVPPANSKVTVLGSPTKLTWHEDGKKMVITIPPGLLKKPISDHTLVIRISS